MRNITRISINKEEVVRYDHDFVNKSFKIYIAKGSADAAGNFVQEPSGSLEVVELTDTNYDNFIGKLGLNEVCPTIRRGLYGQLLIILGVFK